MATGTGHLRVLHVSNMWPAPGLPHFGVFVEAQVNSLRRRGITCEVVHVRRDYLALRRRTQEALRSGTFDLVHAHFGYTAAVVAEVCARLRTPLLVSYCGGDINGEEGRVARRTRSWVGSVASRLAGFAAAAIVVKTAAMIERLPHALRKRTEIIPNGVDLDSFVPASRIPRASRLGLTRISGLVRGPASRSYQELQAGGGCGGGACGPWRAGKADSPGRRAARSSPDVVECGRRSLVDVDARRISKYRQAEQSERPREVRNARKVTIAWLLEGAGEFAALFLRAAVGSQIARAGRWRKNRAGAVKESGRSDSMRIQWQGSWKSCI